MLGRVFRTWPRLLWGMGFLGLFLALGSATGHFSIAEHGLEVETTRDAVVAALAVVLTLFLCIAVPLVIFAIIAPGIAHMVELLTLTLVLLIPVSMLREAVGLPVWVDCIALFGLYLALAEVFFGGWGTKLLRRDTGRKSTSFTVPAPKDAVWAKLAPLPEHQDSYHWPKAQFMAAPEGSAVDFVMHLPRRRGLVPAVEGVTIEDHVPGTLLQYVSEPMDGGPMKERVCLRLSDTANGTKVEAEVSFLDAPLPSRLRLWLGNDARDYLRSLRNRALGRRDGTVHGRQVLPT